MYKTISQFAPEGVEVGVALALQDDSERYLFFVAGTRHHCPPDELFYAGIGGHREAGEGWLDCVHREVKEEIGTQVGILPAPTTWYVPVDGPSRELDLDDRPRPVALTEMIHPPGTPREGKLYRIVIYRGRLRGEPKIVQLDEVRSVIALTEKQVIEGPDRRPTINDLLVEGAAIVVGEENVDLQTCLYPLGTARALASLLPILTNWA